MERENLKISMMRVIKKPAKKGEEGEEGDGTGDGAGAAGNKKMS